MVVCYLDSLHKSSQQFGIWDPCNPYNANIGGLFLGLLKFWGHDFNYETSGLLLEPPCIYPKSLGLPVSDLHFQTEISTDNVLALHLRSPQKIGRKQSCRGNFWHEAHQRNPGLLLL